MNQIIFEPSHQAVEFEGEKTILDLARKGKVPVRASCGGNGTCGTCLVKVIKGVEQLEERGPQEQEIASWREYTAEERLGCQTNAIDGLVVEVVFPDP